MTRASLASRRRRWAEDDRLRMIVIFVPPALLVFTTFVILPMIEAGFFASWRWNGYGPAPWALNEATGAPFGRWVGTQNFERMLVHSAFHQAVWNSILVIVVSLAVQLPLALFLALMIHRASFANTIFRLIFFLPYILAEVATGLIFAFAFDGNHGLSAWVSQVTGAKEAWFPLAETPWAFCAILAVLVWKYFGFHMMIYIAALQSISDDLLESAKIDGASALQQAWQIKIPLIWPAITVSIFYAVLGALQVFDLVMPMTAGGPSNSSNTLVSYLYTFGVIRMDIGYGSAIGVFLFASAAVFAITHRSTAQSVRS